VGSLVGGKYQIESLIGQGGMGTVWRAVNVRLEIPVAIKWLRAGQNHDDSLKRLITEARAIAKLVHPSIVRVFDIEESEAGEPFIVMELLQGESFSELLRRAGPLSCVEAVRLLLPIVEGLSLAHAQGVVHRDLKPDNIFICSDGEEQQPKLLDFGIAKLTSGAPSHMTASGTLIGSPEYMSPEQVCGQDDIDFRSDIWSFCVVLYEAIAGKTPFARSNYQALWRSIVEDTPEPANGADAQLWSVLASGLSKDRAQRPSSIFEVGQKLADWLNQQGIQTDATGGSLGTKWLARTGRSLAPLSASSVTSSTSGSLKPVPPRRWYWRTVLMAAATTALVLASAAWSLQGASSEAVEASAPATASHPSAEPEQTKSGEDNSEPPAPAQSSPAEDHLAAALVPAAVRVKSVVPSRVSEPQRQPPPEPSAAPPEATVVADVPPPPRASPKRDSALDLMQPY
jgi:serine/threonine-protein kinase